MKLFLTIAFFLLLLKPTQAQVSLGLKAGFSVTRLKNTQPTKSLLITGNGGFLCRVEGKKKLFLLSELLYSYKGSSVDLQYINMPVLAGWHFNRHFSALLGLEPGLLLSASYHINGEPTHKLTEEFRPFDLGLVVGLQWKFTQRWGMEARCIYGLTYTMKTVNDSRSGPLVLEDKYNPHNEGVQLGAFYLLK